MSERQSAAVSRNAARRTIAASLAIGFIAPAVYAPNLPVTAIVEDEGSAHPATVDPFFGTEVKLIPGDTAANDYFGCAVSVSGDTAIVGAFRNDDACPSDPECNSGAAYIFHRDEGGAGAWGEVLKLTASDAAIGDNFGYAVAICGDLAIVGAYRADDGAYVNAGAAYIFQRDEGGPGNWGEVAKLLANDPTVLFGQSVALSTDTAIVGASGSACIFQRDWGGAGNWGEVTKPTASDSQPGDQFGHSVSISNDTAIVGAPHSNYHGFGSGAAYIFERDWGGADNWGQRNWAHASDGAPDDWFGSAVSINGDTAIVGAPGDDDGGGNTGSAYMFNRAWPDNWREVKKLTASGPATSDQFGSAVSISGDTAIVGVPGDDAGGINSGSVYLFRRDEGEPNNWGETGKQTASDASGAEAFGSSVSISGDVALVGAMRDDDACPGDPECYSGSAYVFFDSESSCQRYDMNGDGFVSIIGDVPRFVACVYLDICDCPGLGCTCPGDCNCDGFLSVIGDVPCFVDCVYFGNCDVCGGR